ncbi:MAG: hypothetical protein IT450_11190 [Phycisphaerales bacterium]|nr:hypothetical protein [Phycisphaerales bacterium]
MTMRVDRLGGYSLAAVALLASPSLGQNAPSGSGRLNSSSDARTFAFAASPFTLTQSAPATQKSAAKSSESATTQKSEQKKPPAKEVEGEHDKSPFHYREISDFYNIREAYSNVEKGEWEFETSFEWETSSSSKDTYGPLLSLKYGITDTFHVELEVEQIVLGQGGDQGNGDLTLLVFKEWWKEAEVLPAFGMWGEMRIPSGQGSSGVDGQLHFTFTKQVCPKARMHFEGFIETANGARGGEEEELRRAFQWGAGPGFDYSFSDDTIATVNYLMRSSEEYGHHNQNILEFGMAQRIAQNQHVKLALDVGLDGAEETPNLGAKILWSIEW